MGQPRAEPGPAATTKTTHIMKKYAIYIRVSTKVQGASGLGMESQLQTCEDYVRGVGGEVSEVFQDIESGKSRTRGGLWSAIEHCKATGETLVIAKLDRLARDVEFTFRVINTGIDIHFVDMPQVNTIILGVFASVAQYERELISSRTKAALDAKKARGELTGGCKELWGKVTGASRKEAMSVTTAASALSRRERAKEKPENIAFRNFIEDWEEMHGKLGWQADWIAVADKLRSRGYKTPTGLDYTPKRACSMYRKITQLYQ